MSQKVFAPKAFSNPTSACAINLKDDSTGPGESEKDQLLSIQDKFKYREIVIGIVFLVDYSQENMSLSLRRNSYEKASFVRSAFSLGLR